MPPRFNLAHSEEDPSQAGSNEQQALYNQLKMTDDDLEEWMFGDQDIENFQPGTALSFPHTFPMGNECRLSDSELWPLHEQYYANMGVSAWDSLVPCFITSSAYIAEAYAEMIVAFLEDHYQHLDLSEPLYILEMATGVGRFSFLLLKELEKKLACFSKFEQLQLRYVMTDFTENNVNFWREHPSLQPFLLKGMLDFAVFRPEEDSTLNLMVSGQTLSPGKVKNPLIAIANYFFDTIRQDLFRVNDYQLEEGLVTLERTINSAEQKAAFPKFSELRPNCRYQGISPQCYYPETEFNQILADYQREIRHGSIIFPIGALRVIKNLEALSNNNVFLLSSDKAFAEMNHMLLYRQHTFQVHGSFSYMVNYDAIGRYFKNRQGHYYNNSQWSTTLATVCCVATQEPSPSRERLEYYVSQHLNGSSRITSTLNAGSEETCRITQALATIRLNLGDTRILCAEAPKLVENLEQATQEQKHDLLELMELAGQKAFFFRGERNLSYWLAELYDRLGLPEKSLEWVEHAMTGYSEYLWEYSYMKGRALEKLNQRMLALECYRQSTILKPDFDQAYRALKNLETLMQSTSFPQINPMSA